MNKIFIELQGHQYIIYLLAIRRVINWVTG